MVMQFFLGRNFLLKFRENNPKAYTEWYTNYKAKVEMQKLISRTKNGSECSTPVSTQSHDVYVSNVISVKMYILYFIYMFSGSLNHMVKREKEKEIHRTTPPRYQKYHINGKFSLNYLLYYGFLVLIKKMIHKYY